MNAVPPEPEGVSEGGGAVPASPQGEPDVTASPQVNDVHSHGSSAPPPTTPVTALADRPPPRPLLVPEDARPVLLVSSPGPRAQEMAAAVVDAFSQGGAVPVAVMGSGPGAELRDLRSGQFPSVAIVLPDRDLARLEAVADAYARWVDDYRRRDRPRRLSEALAGDIKWFELGTVQLFGVPSIVDHPAVLRLSQMVDVVHRVTESGPVDPVAIYHGRGPGGVRFMNGLVHREEEFEEARRTLRSWGVTSIKDVHCIRYGIESIALAARDEPRNSVKRPLGDQYGTAYDIVLHGPTPTVGNESAQKANKEALAKAVRDAIDTLRKGVPSLARPTGGSKATNQFRQLYAAAHLLSERGYW